MRRRGVTLIAMAALLAVPARARAHPTPLSIVDVHLEPSAVEVTVTAHLFDLEHDLGGAPAGPAIAALVGGRLAVAVDGRPLDGAWSEPERLADRGAVRLRQRGTLPTAPARLTVRGKLFPYDPAHQTFINVYESGVLATQAILEARFEHALARPAGWLGWLAVARKFVPAGIRHIAGGVDHLLFLVGLLLLGGSVRRLLLVVSAFTAGHSLTLTLAALALVSPPARFVEPAIALTIVCVGADNLMAGGGRGRDLRPWFALAFGLIHGFGFAGALREMGLPRGALALSLAAFNVGVELGQIALVVVVASALAALRARSERVGQRIAWAGSVGVVAAGAFWFIQRLFFISSGGIS